jgi:arsenate reductase
VKTSEVDLAPYHVLFLCTGNSARSILAEALVNHRGQGRFTGWSAGSHPKGDVHPLALETLRRFGVPSTGLRSKSWEEFEGPSAPTVHFVITVCDRAAGEVCPIWPGRPMTAHWGVEDPAAVEGDEETKLRAFEKAFRELDARIKVFTSLPIETLDPLALRRDLEAIGTISGSNADKTRLHGPKP